MCWWWAGYIGEAPHWETWFGTHIAPAFHDSALHLTALPCRTVLASIGLSFKRKIFPLSHCRVRLRQFFRWFGCGWAAWDNCSASPLLAGGGNIAQISWHCDHLLSLFFLITALDVEFCKKMVIFNHRFLTRNAFARKRTVHTYIQALLYSESHLQLHRTTLPHLR